MHRTAQIYDLHLIQLARDNFKHMLQHSYITTPWFRVRFYGFGSQWFSDARLNIAAGVLHRNVRRKIWGQILQSFKSHLSETVSWPVFFIPKNFELNTTLAAYRPWSSKFDQDGLPIWNMSILKRLMAFLSWNQCSQAPQSQLQHRTVGLFRGPPPSSGWEMQQCTGWESQDPEAVHSVEVEKAVQD